MISDGILDELAGVSVPRIADTLWQERIRESTDPERGSSDYPRE